MNYENKMTIIGVINPLLRRAVAAEVFCFWQRPHGRC